MPLIIKVMRVYIMCGGAFVKRVNQGYTHTQYISTEDVLEIEDTPSYKKRL